MTVIIDLEQVLALYLAAGTPFKILSTYHSSHLPVGEWECIDDIWRNDMVRIMYPGDAHAYLAFWEAGRFRMWYVNIESAYERTPIGVDFTDHILDVVVRSDLSSWEWKDENELAGAVALGLVTEAQADSFYAEGRRAIERLEAMQSPFADGWEKWRPDPQWQIPTMSPQWQSIP